MAALTPEIVGDVVAACRESADEIVATFSRAFDGQLDRRHDRRGDHLRRRSNRPRLRRAGLAIVSPIRRGSAVAVLPEVVRAAARLVSRSPIATGKSKLSTLAQELSMLLLPASLAADEFHVVPLEPSGEALARAELAAEAPLVPLMLKAAEKEGQISLLWPVAKHDELLKPESAPQQTGGGGTAAPAATKPDDELSPLAAPYAQLSQGRTCRCRCNLAIAKAHGARHPRTGARVRSSSSTSRATSCSSSWSATSRSRRAKW